MQLDKPDRDQSFHTRFAEMVKGADDQIELMDAAFLIARTAYPEFDAAVYTARLDAWAGRLRQSLVPASSVSAVLSRMNRILFEEEGFQGDRQNYFDPQNSFLNRVLDRKQGIPITLSIIYCELGRRAGFALHPIALPGHFIAALFHVSGILYVDPFNKGEVLTPAECRTMIANRFGPEVARQSGWQVPASKKVILKRMLRNLKGIYHHQGNFMQHFEMIQWLLSIDPDDPIELKQRAELYETLGNYAFAVQDLEHYLRVAPKSEDKPRVDEKIRELNRLQRPLH